MSAGEIVYVISSGEYSDYRVVCACPSKEDAEQLAARMNGGRSGDYYEYQVEELALLPGDVQQVETLRLSTTLWDDGRETDTWDRRDVDWPTGTYDHQPVGWRWVRAPMHRNRGGRLDVWGINHERVRKVYGERRALFMTDEAMRSRREVAS